MKPSYAHVPDPRAGGTCGECKHARAENKRYRAHAVGNIWTRKKWTCAKAVELARYPGEGAPIMPETQGCKYWEFEFREAAR